MVHCVNQFGVSLELGGILQAVIMKAQFIQKPYMMYEKMLDAKETKTHY